MEDCKKVVLTYGTFDLFHVGHVNLLERASMLGDYLIVGVSTDEFNESKGKRSFFSFNDRKKIVESCRYVDMVLPESSWEQKENDIIQYGVDTFVMGSDWRGKFDVLSNLCNVIYLDRTPGVSSTQVKNMSGENIHSSVAKDLESAKRLIDDILERISDLK